MVRGLLPLPAADNSSVLAAYHTHVCEVLSMASTTDSVSMADGAIMLGDESFNRSGNFSVARNVDLSHVALGNTALAIGFPGDLDSISMGSKVYPSHTAVGTTVLAINIHDGVGSFLMEDQVISLQMAVGTTVLVINILNGVNVVSMGSKIIPS